MSIRWSSKISRFLRLVARLRAGGRRAEPGELMSFNVDWTFACDTSLTRNCGPNRCSPPLRLLGSSRRLRNPGSIWERILCLRVKRTSLNSAAQSLTAVWIALTSELYFLLSRVRPLRKRSGLARSKILNESLRYSLSFVSMLDFDAVERLVSFKRS